MFACSSVSLKQCWYSSEKERENAERYGDGGEVKEGGRDEVRGRIHTLSLLADCLYCLRASLALLGI